MQHRSIYYGLFSVVAFLSAMLWLFFNSAPSTPKPVKQLSHWQYHSNFNIGRRAFAAANTQHHIYVLGGVDEQGAYLRNVEFARIQPDGSLGTWRATSLLNEGRFYLSAVVIDDYLYAIGGADGPLGEDNIPSATVERARILASGELGPWEYQPYLNSPRRGLQAVSYNSYIYALGGYNGQFLKTVERAEVDKMGNIVRWINDENNFLVDRYIHSAAIHNDRIYLIAGHVEKQDIMSYSDVESARILQNGQLTPWRIEKAKLNTPRFIASAVSLNNYLYIVGGHNGADRLTSVEYATIHNDGSLDTWHTTLPLQTARSANMLLAHNNSLYSLGGAGGLHVLNSVEMSKQLPNGQLTATQAMASPSSQSPDAPPLN